MRLWRLTRAVHADLSGEGARRFGGRWNSPSRPLVYTAAEATLTVLEVRVNLDLPFELLPDDYVLLIMFSDPVSPPDPVFPAVFRCPVFRRMMSPMRVGTPRGSGRFDYCCESFSILIVK